MMVLRRLWMAVAAGALLLAPLAATGCSGAQVGKETTVTSGEMPAGGEWTGVWYNELYGYLHVIEESGKIKGKWKRKVGDKWGELEGSVTGDLMKFTWKEHTTGVVGPNSSRVGKGYFKYKRPPGDNVDDLISGEIGLGNDEVGDSNWEAVKQREMKPNLQSIGGTGASDVGGGEWDGVNKEQGSPEPPTSPPAP